MARLILDTSTVARWTGPPVGIVRVEHELARHALRARPDVVLSFFDPRIGRLRELAPRWRADLLGLDAAIDATTLDFRRQRPAWRNLLSPRYPAVMALERLRLTGGPLATLASLAQQALLGRYLHRPPFGDAQGRRSAILPAGAALGPVLVPGPGDTVLSAGSDWLHKGPALLALQRATGFRLAVICYDMLPITHPGFFKPQDVAPFRAYWREVLPAAARVLCNAACIARDITSFAAAEGIATPPPRVVPLGLAPPTQSEPGPLPDGLTPDRFALFVSTIEPRKGHAVLLDAWQRLCEAGLPQRHGFRLVFVGRPGWQVEAVLDRLRADNPAFAGTVHHLQGIDDAMLARLYRAAAFCLYPSRYEGFGLPVIEAFAHGKPVIASTGGALPETVAGLSPCLDPLDTDAWTAMLASWIADPQAPAAWAARIAAEFRPLPWPDAAEGIMQAAID